MIAYVEASAAAKLLFREPDSKALRKHLTDVIEADGDLYSSLLLETELRQAAVREGSSQEVVTDLLERFNLVEIEPTIFRDAGLMAGANLRSLDALHLATALRTGAEVLVSYDRRQIEAARAAGLRTVSPS